MAETAEIVVIGGGVVGASVACHLAMKGCRSVLVLDRGAPGQGSTGRATGGYRAQFGTTIHVRLSLLAREKLLRFPEEIGADPGYRPNGYLFCAAAPEQMAALRAANAIQREAGLTSVTFPPPETMAEMVPGLRCDDLVGGAFCPTDGFIRPMQILEGYRAAAERLGVTFRWGETVTGFTRDASNAITAVETDRQTVATRQVALAAGAWSAQVAALAGIPDLPVVPVRRQVALTGPVPLADSLPMVIDCGNGFHTRMRDGRALLLWADPNEPPGFRETFDPAFLDAVRPKVAQRLPVLADAPIAATDCWAGLYEVTPDHHGILGWAPETPGLLLVTGFSGHGVMHSPVTGQLAAEMLLDGATQTLDVSALRPERFAEGALNVEAAVI